MTDLSTNRKVRTISDLMIDIESEISEIKSGKLTEGKARIIGTYRRMQLRGVEIYLQAARLEAKLRGGLAERMGEIPGAGAGPTANSIRAKSRKEVSA